jgi:ATP-dependent helicase HepA
VTFDRNSALAREDIAFMTPDHPIFRDALGVLLSREQGNCTFGHWKTARGKTMLLECHFVLECLAPVRLHADRFLPPTAFRVVVDHKGADHSDDPALLSATIEPGSPRKLVSQHVFRQEILPAMLKKAEEIISGQARLQIRDAERNAKKSLTAEIDRLEELAQRNRHIASSEIEELTSYRDELLKLLAQSRLRLDAIRLIWRAPG